MDALAKLSNIGVSLGGKPVLRGVNLTVRAGEVVGVAGSNGSGKTTLVRTLATLQGHEGGAGQVLGADLGSRSILAVRPQIGLISHTPALIPELTLRENLIHVSRLAGLGVDRVEPALEVVGLDAVADRRGDAASFGMQRRVEAALLLIRRPTLLMLDEAVSGLDDSASDLIDALIETTTGRGGAAVIVSHDRDQMLSSSDRTMQLSTGRLEALR